jgi:hypothetical protein
MGFEICGVDHDRRLLAVVSGQTGHHLRKDAFVALPLPTVIERFCGFRGPTGATVPFNYAGRIPLAHLATASHCD